MMATFSYKKNHMQTKSDKKDIATILQEKKEDFESLASIILDCKIDDIRDKDNPYQYNFQCETGCIHIKNNANIKVLLPNKDLRQYSTVYMTLRYDCLALEDISLDFANSLKALIWGLEQYHFKTELKASYENNDNSKVSIVLSVTKKARRNDLLGVIDDLRYLITNGYETSKRFFTIEQIKFVWFHEGEYVEEEDYLPDYDY